MLPKRYDHRLIESRWLERWTQDKIYHFDPSCPKPIYSIDTPPPYPSGEFHMGNALNWVYQDIVARYKRMRGYNVLFPQGWDCHGLPTEVEVEKRYGIKKGDLPRDEFRQRCIQLTLENISKMKQQMLCLGLSMNWNREYRTMDPEYWAKTQISFIRLFNKGYIYRGTHPVEWCPRCQTAIAHAEVEYETRSGMLHYIKFGELVIATTRPELLYSCVAIAVHPQDPRYAQLVGREFPVPLYDRQLKLISDPEVDPEFGTGVVMICTFGDRVDVRWVKRHSLPVIQSLDERGCMLPQTGYGGLTVEQARTQIVQDLRSRGLLLKSEPITQNIGVCWRCKTPVEILPKLQWFMDVTSWKQQIIRSLDRTQWYPEYYKQRLLDWINSMEWDWVISRQRYFATPIPVWYCASCGKPKLASEQECPLDPITTNPTSSCECGSNQFIPEQDVMDTWMDSSITIAVHAGWLESGELFQRCFPADLQPNGHDIIRTWDYYLLVKHLALFDQVPYKQLLINGIVLGQDGRKMSKSLGNYVLPSQPIQRYGADAVRIWCVLSGAPGSDIRFSWKEILAASRFLQKLWSIARFCSQFSSDHRIPIQQLHLLDRWLMDKLSTLISQVTQHLEQFRFDLGFKAIYDFCWELLADEYIEAVKHRVYNPSQEFQLRSAAQSLHAILDILPRLLAPFTPFIAEELNSLLSSTSVHLREWPNLDFSDPQARQLGDHTLKLISLLRRYKSQRRIPLNAPLQLKLYPRAQLELETIARTLNAQLELIDSDLQIQGWEILDTDLAKIWIRS